MTRLGLIWIALMVPCFCGTELLRAEDLDQLQGTWERTITQNGVEQRVVKTILGKKETVEVFLNGKLVQKHRVDFELSNHGPAKIFTWRNGQILDGPNAGKKLGDGRFLYRLDKDRWIGVFGMLDGEKVPVSRESWNRTAEPPAPPAT